MLFGCGCLQAARPLMGLCGRSPLWTSVGCPSPTLSLCAGGSQPLIRLRAHPGAFCLCAQAAECISGHAPTPGFRYGPQATDWGTHPLGHFGSGAQAPRPLFRSRAHLEFQFWAPIPLIWVRASRASGELRGCFSAFTFQGLTREGRQRPRLLQRVL